MRPRRAARVLLAACLLTACACTSSESGPQSEGRAASSRAQSSATPSPTVLPRRGGSVRVGVVGAPATLDPYSPVASDSTLALARPLYPSLYRLSPEGLPEPMLARGMDVRAGGARVELRRARWSDGRPITSRDVVASIERATFPSGFGRLTAARALSRRVVSLRGPISEWPRALATRSFVLPRGRAATKGEGLIGGSDWRASAYTPGLKIVYADNRFDPERPYLERVSVLFYETETTLLDALRDGRVDVAVPPSTINLDDRLEQMGVGYDSALGWESIRLDLRASIPRADRAALVAGIDRGALEASFIRDGGRVSRTLHPGPRGTRGRWRDGYGKKGRIEEPVRLAIPSGDELLFLLQRAIQIQLTQRKIDVDLVVGSVADFYGPWRATLPADVALVRSVGAPGLRDPARPYKEVTAFPLAHVRTYLAWREGVNGVQVNPTFDGPLWNMASWWVSRKR